MNRLVLGVVGMFAVCASGLAVAQTVTMKPEDVVHARQSGMAMTGAIAGMIKAGLASGTDVKNFAEASAALLAYANTYTSLFPDGTQDVANTKAKPEIWTDRAGFEKANAAFVTASTNLEAAAKSGDKDAFTAAFQAEGRTCGGCHRAYQAK